MPKILRLTLFKIPDAAHVEEAVKKYSTLTQDAVKGDAKYILDASAAPAFDDPRSQGFTVVAKTVFESKEDMDYYDNECSAHQEIKRLLKPKVSEQPCVVYMPVDGT